MNLGDIRRYVRETLESDNEEFSDFIIDNWVREGWLEIHRSADWPFLDTTWTLSTAVFATDFAQIVDAEGNVPQTIRSVRSQEGELAWLAPAEIQSVIANDRYYSTTTTTGIPRFFSVRGGRTLLIAPALNEAANFTVQGYRARRDWFTNGDASVPDLPEDLQVALQYYALGRAYQRLDDPQSSIHHLDLFNSVVSSTAIDLNSSQFGGTMQIGGGHGVRDRDTNTTSVAGLRSPNTRIVVSDA